MNKPLVILVLILIGMKAHATCRTTSYTDSYGRTYATTNCDPVVEQRESAVSKYMNSMRMMNDGINTAVENKRRMNNR